MIQVLQPVSMVPDDDWTDSLEPAIDWFSAVEERPSAADFRTPRQWKKEKGPLGQGPFYLVIRGLEPYQLTVGGSAGGAACWSNLEA